MKEIRALVADDELPARGELTYELSNIPGVKVIGECGNGREVLAFLKTHPNVDILFLDIEMPLMNGLECAKETSRQPRPDGKGTSAGRDRLHLTEDLPPDAGQDHHDLPCAGDRPDL